jgi:hypothetical protein
MGYIYISSEQRLSLLLAVEESFKELGGSDGVELQVRQASAVGAEALAFLLCLMEERHALVLVHGDIGVRGEVATASVRRHAASEGDDGDDGVGGGVGEPGLEDGLGSGAGSHGAWVLVFGTEEIGE